MSIVPPTVRPITLDEIRSARERIQGIAVRTPLIKLRHDAVSPEVWLKLENLQPINAFKIRGAANAVAMLSSDERRHGVCTLPPPTPSHATPFPAPAFP